MTALVGSAAYRFRGRTPEHALGPDLRQMLADLELRVVQVRPISPVAAASTLRAAWRLTLADGRFLKARRFSSNLTAARLAQVYRCFTSNRFPHLLGQRRGGILESWLDGASLDRARLSPERMRECGAFLGSIHATAVPYNWPTRRPTLQHLRDKVMSKLARLRQEEIVDRQTARLFFETLRCAEPSGAEVGFVHRDFSAENLVVCAGRVCSIDNATMCVDAFDEDLARTWYRWPMSAGNWNNFLEGYRRFRNTDLFFEHFRYWAMIALVRTLSFRALHDRANVQHPLNYLRELLTGEQKVPHDAAQF